MMEKLDQTPTLAHVLLGAASDMEFRLPDWQGQQQHPTFAQWYS